MPSWLGGCGSDPATAREETARLRFTAHPPSSREAPARDKSNIEEKVDQVGSCTAERKKEEHRLQGEA
jgi:hypothetical protein